MQTENGYTHAGLRQSRGHDTAKHTTTACDDGGATLYIEARSRIKIPLRHISSSRCRSLIVTYYLYPKSGIDVQRSLREYAAIFGSRSLVNTPLKKKDE